MSSAPTEGCGKTRVLEWGAIAYSAIRKGKRMPIAETWMGLEVIILSEVSQNEKDKYHMISLTCVI